MPKRELDQCDLEAEREERQELIDKIYVLLEGAEGYFECDYPSQMMTSNFLYANMVYKALAFCSIDLLKKALEVCETRF